jgi:peptidoglycan lytic transglycosylase
MLHRLPVLERLAALSTGSAGRNVVSLDIARWRASMRPGTPMLRLLLNRLWEKLLASMPREPHRAIERQFAVTGFGGPCTQRYAHAKRRPFRPSLYFALALASATMLGCAQPERAPQPSPPSSAPSPPIAPSPAPAVARPPEPPSPGATASTQQRGRISTYGNDFAGKKTASGEAFDPNALTMAHRTLPFGTRVRVTNLENQRSVEVVVNDRGPFVAGRIADLSEAAARRVGMVSKGVVEALLDILQPGKAE